MKELRPLRLPMLVEARRKRESCSPEAETVHSRDRTRTVSTTLSSAQETPASDENATIMATQTTPDNFTSSEIALPITPPTYTMRHQAQSPSTAAAATSSPALHESIEGFAPKRPLTEVMEEPQHERDDDFEMIDAPMTRTSSECGNTTLCDGRDDESEDPAMNETTPEPSRPDSGIEYDWLDHFEMDDRDFAFTAKRRRANPPSPAGMTSRLGSRFPVLTRRWRTRREQRKSSVESVQDSVISRSRASSVRAPSIFDVRTEIATPLSPTHSFVAEETCEELHDDLPLDPTHPNALLPAAIVDDEDDILQENEAAEPEVDESHNRTPLLPPLMTAIGSPPESPIRSPLDSPAVAAVAEVIQSPQESPVGGASALPSPPLSTRPSLSSFHASAHHRPIVMPSADIPPMLLDAPTDHPDDAWALRLGHANFTIFPEPYAVASPATIPDCKRLRADWEAARSAFNQHLERTAAHHSTNSDVYRLTEAKWAEVDAEWKRCHEQALASVAPLVASPMTSPTSEMPALPTAQLTGVPEAVSVPTAIHPTPELATPGLRSSVLPSPPTRSSSKRTEARRPIRMPELDSGKFPSLGEDGIVGPMEQASPLALQQPPRAPPGPPLQRRMSNLLRAPLASSATSSSSPPPPLPRSRASRSRRSSPPIHLPRATISKQSLAKEFISQQPLSKTNSPSDVMPSAFSSKESSPRRAGGRKRAFWKFLQGMFPLGHHHDSEAGARLIRQTA